MHLLTNHRVLREGVSNRETNCDEKNQAQVINNVFMNLYALTLLVWIEALFLDGSDYHNPYFY